MAEIKRAYTGGHFLLSLDGEPALLKDVDGGNIKAEIVNFKMGPQMFDLKHISTLKYEPFTINVGMSMGKSLYEWIKASLDLSHMRKNGYVVAADFNYKAQQYRHFRDALITEFTVPALDAASKDSAYFTLKIQPEEIVHQGPDNADIKGTVNTKQKRWLTSNFRLELGGMDCSKVSKIDSFTIKQNIVQDDVGHMRIPEQCPASIEFPNLKITIAKSTEATWRKWFDDFVIKGNNGQEKELNGVIEFLDPSTSEVLGSINLMQVGIFSISDSKAEAGKAEVAKVTIEAYVEQMTMDLKYT
jgi:phage tail-like protein